MTPDDLREARARGYVGAERLNLTKEGEVNRCHRCGASWEVAHLCFSDRPVDGKDLVGLQEVADLFGISKQLANKWTKVYADFPKPLAELKGGRVWSKRSVEAWKTERDR